jgi:hypothetical protein
MAATATAYELQKTASFGRGPIAARQAMATMLESRSSLALLRSQQIIIAADERHLVAQEQKLTNIARL